MYNMATKTKASTGRRRDKGPRSQSASVSSTEHKLEQMLKDSWRPKGWRYSKEPSPGHLSEAQIAARKIQSKKNMEEYKKDFYAPHKIE